MRVMNVSYEYTHVQDYYSTFVYPQKTQFEVNKKKTKEIKSCINIFSHFETSFTCFRIKFY